VKPAIAASVRAGDSPSPAAGDNKGRFHAEGGIWGRDASGKPIPVPAVPGKAVNPLLDSLAEIRVAVSEEPNAKNTLVSIDGQWHVHPSGSVAVDDKIHFFVQTPSPGDRASAAFPINIVVGAGSKRVYFYNSDGAIGKPMKLKNFMGR
jgi:hypothetical protein